MTALERLHQRAKSWRVANADMRDELARMEPDSVDAIVCDPPYELSFMGKKWDGTGISFDPATWAACLRVLKPGGHLLAFGGTRTIHRITCAIEDAGFEIRDQISWLYGTGFPKSHNVSKAIDRQVGAVRDVVGHQGRANPQTVDRIALDYGGATGKAKNGLKDGHAITAPATEDAKRWEGWGTALKPACEPITVARKPLIGTVAANVLAHGTGGLNIDASRISTGDNLNGGAYAEDASDRPDGSQSWRYKRGDKGNSGEFQQPEGRWPANLILQHKPNCRCTGTKQVKSDGHFPSARPAGSQVSGPSGHEGQTGLDERHMSGEEVAVWDCAEGCPVRALDEQSGVRPSTGPHPSSASVESIYRPGQGAYQTQGPLYDDTGGASRFFKQVGGRETSKGSGEPQ